MIEFSTCSSPAIRLSAARRRFWRQISGRCQIADLRRRLARWPQGRVDERIDSDPCRRRVISASQRLANSQRRPAGDPIMKDLRVAHRATGQSHGAGNNATERWWRFLAARPDSMSEPQETEPGIFAPAPHLEHIRAMFDCERLGALGPRRRRFAAILEVHPAYPNLRSGRHRALLSRLDDIVANHLASLSGILQGFDLMRPALGRIAHPR